MDCWKGDECEYCHDLEAAEGQQEEMHNLPPDASKRKFCTSFQKKGRCRFGSSCWFEHLQSGADAAAARKRKREEQVAKEQPKSGRASGVLGSAPGNASAGNTNQQ